MHALEESTQLIGFLGAEVAQRLRLIRLRQGNDFLGHLSPFGGQMQDKRSSVQARLYAFDESFFDQAIDGSGQCRGIVGTGLGHLTECGVLGLVNRHTHAPLNQRDFKGKKFFGERLPHADTSSGQKEGERFL